jgi:hypothetical protein
MASAHATARRFRARRLRARRTRSARVAHEQADAHRRRQPGAHAHHLEERDLADAQLRREHGEP